MQIYYRVLNFIKTYAHTLYMVAFTVEGNANKHKDEVLILLEKEMATHSSTLAWKIPWTEEPSRLQSMESQRVGHD